MTKFETLFIRISNRYLTLNLKRGCVWSHSNEMSVYMLHHHDTSQFISLVQRHVQGLEKNAQQTTCQWVRRAFMSIDTFCVGCQIIWLQVSFLARLCMPERCSNTTQNWLSAEINNELSGDDVKQSSLSLMYLLLNDDIIYQIIQLVSRKFTPKKELLKFMCRLWQVEVAIDAGRVAESWSLMGRRFRRRYFSWQPHFQMFDFISAHLCALTTCVLICILTSY